MTSGIFPRTALHPPRIGAFLHCLFTTQGGIPLKHCAACWGPPHPCWGPPCPCWGHPSPLLGTPPHSCAVCLRCSSTACQQIPQHCTTGGGDPSQTSRSQQGAPHSPFPELFACCRKGECPQGTLKAVHVVEESLAWGRGSYQLADGRSTTAIPENREFQKWKLSFFTKDIHC